MWSWRVARLGLALLALLTFVGVAGLLIVDKEPVPKPLRILFLARGDATADEYFQAFSDAFKSRHTTLARRVSLEALSVADDVHDMDRLVRAATRVAPSLIVAQNGTQARIARQAAPLVPLVFSTHADPLALGIASGLLKRPEPATGLWVNDDLDGKRVEILLDAYPSVRTIALLGDAEWFAALGQTQAQIQTIAEARRVSLRILHAGTVEEAVQLVNSDASANIDAWCLPRTTLSMDGRVGRSIAARGKPIMAGHTPDIYAAANLSYAYDRSFIAPAMADLAARVVLGESAGSIPIQVPHRFQLAVRITSDPRLPALNPAVVRRADLVVR